MSQTLTDEAFVPSIVPPAPASIRERLDTETGEILSGPEYDDERNPNTSVTAAFPQYVTEDFDLTADANGVQRFRPNRVAVQRTIAGAPVRMQRAIDALTPGDIQLIQNLMKDIDAFHSSLTLVDQYMASNFTFSLTQQAMQRAVRAERFSHSARSWMSRLRPTDTHPERLVNLINLARDTAKKGAILFLSVRNAESTGNHGPAKYDRAAWDVMNQEAYKHTQQYLGNNSPTARGENEANASHALLDAI